MFSLKERNRPAGAPFGSPVHAAPGLPAHNLHTRYDAAADVSPSPAGGTTAPSWDFGSISILPRTPESVERTLSAPGRSMEQPLLREMSSLFNFDFSAVRLHDDERANASAAGIGARAYAAGPHIVFSRDSFRPSTAEGRRLLAHELAHVVQAPRLGSGDLVVGRPDSAQERQAENAADTVMGRGSSTGFGGLASARISGVTTGAASIVMRTVDMTRAEIDWRLPRPKAPKLSPASQLIADMLIEIVKETIRKGAPYTQGTQDAVGRLLSAVGNRLQYMEAQGLSKDAEDRLRAITKTMIVAVKKELARPPKDDPYQEGNILGIWRKWHKEFSDMMDYELMRLDLEKLQESIPEEEPGDYNDPDNPLDLPREEAREAGRTA